MCTRTAGGKRKGSQPKKKNKFTSNITPYNAKTVYLSVYLPLRIELYVHSTQLSSTPPAYNKALTT